MFDKSVAGFYFNFIGSGQVEVPGETLRIHWPDEAFLLFVTTESVLGFTKYITHIVVLSCIYFCFSFLF